MPGMPISYRDRQWQVFRNAPEVYSLVDPSDGEPHALIRRPGITKFGPQIVHYDDEAGLELAILFHFALYYVDQGNL